METSLSFPDLFIVNQRFLLYTERCVKNGVERVTIVYFEFSSVTRETTQVNE